MYVCMYVVILIMAALPPLNLFGETGLCSYLVSWCSYLVFVSIHLSLYTPHSFRCLLSVLLEVSYFVVILGGLVGYGMAGFHFGRYLFSVRLCGVPSFSRYMWYIPFFPLLMGFPVVLWSFAIVLWGFWLRFSWVFWYSMFVLSSS